MFKLLESVVNIAADTVTLPVAAAADVVTFGGLMTERKETYTYSKLKKIVEEIEEIADD